MKGFMNKASRHAWTRWGHEFDQELSFLRDMFQ